MKICSRYLKLPVGNGPAGVMSIMEDGIEVYSFQVAYQPDDSMFDMYADLLPWMGKDVTISFHGEEVCGLSFVDQPDKAVGEEMRPLAHFTSPWGWINDPNGLSWYCDRYHLFYQHNPMGDKWGNMHWGHAESVDLMHWSWVGDTLYPDRLNATMYSGSAVVDVNNTAGFGKNAHILIYTCADNGDAGYNQNLAWSDDGIHYHKYENNPVIANLAPGNRDPKVIWHEKSGRWILVLYLSEDQYAIFASNDLKNWKELQRLSFPNANECPDFFPLLTPEGEEKWILWEAGNKYIIGSFQNDKFIFEEPERELSPREAEPRLYAAQTIYQDPKGRRIIIFWENIKFPGAPFTSQMSIPCTLSLVRGGDGGLMLKASPVEEYMNKRTELSPSMPVWFEADLKEPVEVDGHVFRAEKGYVIVDDKRYSAESGRVSILVDRMSAEIFADGGTKIYLFEGEFALSGRVKGANTVYSIQV